MVGAVLVGLVVGVALVVPLAATLLVVLVVVLLVAPVVRLLGVGVLVVPLVLVTGVLRRRRVLGELRWGGDTRALGVGLLEVPLVGFVGLATVTVELLLRRADGRRELGLLGVGLGRSGVVRLRRFGALLRLRGRAGTGLLPGLVRFGCGRHGPLLRRRGPARDVRGRRLAHRVGHVGDAEPVRADVLHELRLGRDAVFAQVVVDGGGPDPRAVAVEGDRHGALGVRREPVEVVSPAGHHHGRAVEVVEHPVLLFDVQLRTVHRGPATRTRAVEDPGHPEPRARAFGAEARHPAHEPVGHVLLGTGEHAQLVGVGLGRRRQIPGGLFPVVLEVVARRVVELVAGVEPGSAPLAVHAGAQTAEQAGDVVGRNPLLGGSVGECDFPGEFVVPPHGAVLDGHLVPVARGGPQQGKADLLDQGVLLGCVQLGR